MPFHYIVYVHRSSYLWWRDACGFQSRVTEAMEALRTFPSAANSVQWNVQMPNDAQQTESVMLFFVRWLRAQVL
ncbi:hypothetical protein TNCV_4850831 [Trichonephila clavipes]|nr:hypothetical protein TNCV_4850831 [Trichonephila clavipes]